MLCVAGDLGGGALRLEDRAERIVEIGADRFDLALRLAALLPFAAGPQAEGKAHDQAQQACDRGVSQRLRVAHEAHAGNAFGEAHQHTALPDQPAAM